MRCGRGGRLQHGLTNGLVANEQEMPDRPWVPNGAGIFAGVLSRASLPVSCQCPWSMLSRSFSFAPASSRVCRCEGCLQRYRASARSQVVRKRCGQRHGVATPLEEGFCARCEGRHPNSAASSGTHLCTHEGTSIVGREVRGFQHRSRGMRPGCKKTKVDCADSFRWVRCENTGGLPEHCRLARPSEPQPLSPARTKNQCVRRGLATRGFHCGLGYEAQEGVDKGIVRLSSARRLLAVV